MIILYLFSPLNHNGWDYFWHQKRLLIKNGKISGEYCKGNCILKTTYQFKTENIVLVFIQFSLQFIGFHPTDSELQEIKDIVMIILAPIINFIFSFSISFDWRIANHLRHINFEIKHQKILIRKKNPAKNCQKFREITFHTKIFICKKIREMDLHLDLWVCFHRTHQFSQKLFPFHLGPFVHTTQQDH